MALDNEFSRTEAEQYFKDYPEYYKVNPKYFDDNRESAEAWRKVQRNAKKFGLTDSEFDRIADDYTDLGDPNIQALHAGDPRLLHRLDVPKLKRTGLGEAAMFGTTVGLIPAAIGTGLAVCKHPIAGAGVGALGLTLGALAGKSIYGDPQNQGTIENNSGYNAVVDKLESGMNGHRGLR